MRCGNCGKDGYHMPGCPAIDKDRDLQTNSVEGAAAYERNREHEEDYQ